MESNKIHFQVSKWIMLSFAVLLNTFLIVTSCLSENATKKMAKPFNNLLTSVVNIFTHKEEQKIPLENITVGLSDKETYEYNYLDGYALNEIPLGSAKQIDCKFYPTSASNKAISYYAEPSDQVILNQSGSIVSVVGMKTGECTIVGKSADGNLLSSTKVNIVETIAPANFNISLQNSEIRLGSAETIDFDIDGGVLTHDKLINFRYYDTRKLTYSSSNESIATVDQNGVIYPKSVGSATISVSNGAINKTLNIETKSGEIPTDFIDLNIFGSSVCYSDDMIRDQNTHKHHYQLIPRDGEKVLNPADFIWESSNELLAKVDNAGILRGFRKSTSEDQTVLITATSKITGQKASISVVVKSKIPFYMDIYINIDDVRIWNQEEYTISAGEDIEVRTNFDVKGTATASSSDENYIKCTSEGDRIIMHVLKEGKCTVTISCVENPSLKRSTNYTIVKSGSVNAKNSQDFEYSYRKTIGHAALFLISQVFTFLTFFMFLNSKRLSFVTILSISEGLLLSIFTEIIQLIVPSRSGRVQDAIINFAGVLVGAGIVLGVLLLFKRKSNQKGREAKK